ncbi:hypothetical protein ACTI_54090 [Actinoplanes sp. OR16]|nr:hypothetical protein ACTI_54090 [Actinoplanes sp. OR16]
MISAVATAGPVPSPVRLSIQAVSLAAPMKKNQKATARITAAHTNVPVAVRSLEVPVMAGIVSHRRSGFRRTQV